MLEPRGAIDVSATGTLDAGRGMLAGAVLVAAGAAATAVVRSGGASGEVIARISAPANTSVSFLPAFVVPYTDLYVTLTGSGALFTAYR